MTPRRLFGESARGRAEKSVARRYGMWGAVRRYEGITDPAEAGRLVDQSFVPLLEQVPGFVAYYWIDAGDGVMASLSVYENQAGADESVRIAHDWVRDNAATLIPNPPQVTEGNVVASDTKQQMDERNRA
jgi:hypothetical protein